MQIIADYGSPRGRRLRALPVLEAVTFRKADYIAAARLQGASPLRIIVRSIEAYLLILIRLTLNMATVILTAAGLGFLGLGAQPPLPEWGAMIATGRRYMLDKLVAGDFQC